MDTIIAISTAMGKGAIAIVRLSGDEAISIVNNCFRGKDLNSVPSHTIHYGKIYDNEEYIDEVLVSVFRAPKTYTRENIVEINCHGGMFVTNRILELMIEKGARLADPGEFTKRAFLNGRIDLTEAEAVMDVINSQTENSLKCANIALRGDVSKLINGFRNRLLDCITKIEVNIDYPEYDDEEQISNEYLKPVLRDMQIDIKEIINKAKISSVIRDGIKTAIIGKPNVGKSSLLNALLRENKAIVTSIAGTTRDIVEGKLNLGGIILNLIDTAGIRETVDEVEKIGVEKTKSVLNEAELVILILDNNQEIEQTDKELLELTKNKPRIILINKNDLPKKIHFEGEALEVSVFSNDDIERIEKKVKEICIMSEINEIDATYIGNARQIDLIKKASSSINEALQSIDNGMPVDMVNIDITNAFNYLGEVTGKGNPDEIINNLFANFCLGK